MPFSDIGRINSIKLQIISKKRKNSVDFAVKCDIIGNRELSYVCALDREILL